MTAASVISRLSSDPVFGQMTEAQKLQVMNGAGQKFANIYAANNRSEFVVTTMTDPVAFASSAIRSGNGVASIAGTPIVFDTAMTTGDYTLICSTGVDFVNPDTQEDTRTAEGFTAFAAADETSFQFVAVKG